MYSYLRTISWNLVNYENNFYNNHNIEYYIMLKFIAYFLIKKAILFYVLYPPNIIYMLSYIWQVI